LGRCSGGKRLFVSNIIKMLYPAPLIGCYNVKRHLLAELTLANHLSIRGASECQK
jgi:hypothetical protein